MGSFYVFGIVKKFDANSTNHLEQAIWKEYLNKRLDIEQYVIDWSDYTANGTLKEEVFKKNIENFYKNLVEITCNESIASYFEDFGTELENYQIRNTRMTFEYHETNITISAEIAILFIEGKVLVEEFSFEPKLINWLFRHIDISNPLRGCVMSDVLG